MKYLKQFLIILSISFIGEALNAFLPLPVPASIYGLVILLAALLTGILPLSKVEETADFLVEIMPVMFIPAAVGLLDTWTDLSQIWVPVCIITVVTTVIVMAVAGRVTQWAMERNHKDENSK